MVKAEIFLRKSGKRGEKEIKEAIAKKSKLTPNFSGGIISFQCNAIATELKSIESIARELTDSVKLLPLPEDKFKDFCLQRNKSGDGHLLTYWDYDQEKGFLKYQWVTGTTPKLYDAHRAKGFSWVCDTFTGTNNARVMAYRFPTAGIKRFGKVGTVKEYAEIRDAFVTMLEKI